MRFRWPFCARLTLPALLICAAVRVPASEVKVFAAASLTDSLKEVASAYHKKTGERVVFNLGASSTLARQIEEGAPADIFFSADETKMDALQAEGLLVQGTRKSRLSNTLVGVVAAENPARVSSPKDLAKPEIKRVALGDPKAVPIGIYAREYLEKLGLWAAVAPKVVPTENVRAALAAVEAGNADASIVYKTDAAISKKVKVAFEVPAGEGPKISYPVAMVTGAATSARSFLDYLDSEEAATVFKKCGFIVLAPPHRP